MRGSTGLATLRGDLSLFTLSVQPPIRLSILTLFTALSHSLTITCVFRAIPRGLFALLRLTLAEALNAARVFCTHAAEGAASIVAALKPFALRRTRT